MASVLCSVVATEVGSLASVAERQVLWRLLSITHNLLHPVNDTIDGLRSSFIGKLLSFPCSTRWLVLPHAMWLFNSMRETTLFPTSTLCLHCTKPQYQSCCQRCGKPTCSSLNFGCNRGPLCILMVQEAETSVGRLNTFYKCCVSSLRLLEDAETSWNNTLKPVHRAQSSVYNDHLKCVFLQTLSVKFLHHSNAAV